MSCEVIGVVVHARLTQEVECFHVLGQLLDAPDAVVYHALPLLQLVPGHGAVCEEQRIARVLLDGLGVVGLCALVVAILEAHISLGLELLSSILVTRRHADEQAGARCCPEDDHRGVLSTVSARKIRRDRGVIGTRVGVGGWGAVKSRGSVELSRWTLM